MVFVLKMGNIVFVDFIALYPMQNLCLNYVFLTVSYQKTCFLGETNNIDTKRGEFLRSIIFQIFAR